MVKTLGIAGSSTFALKSRLADFYVAIGQLPGLGHVQAT